MRRLDGAKDILSEHGDPGPDSSSSDDSDERIPGLSPEIEQMQGNVATIIDCLFRMSLHVRKPAAHDLKTGFTREEM